jgi:hypothetical protein
VPQIIADFDQLNYIYNKFCRGGAIDDVTSTMKGARKWLCFHRTPKFSFYITVWSWSHLSYYRSVWRPISYYRLVWGRISFNHSRRQPKIFGFYCGQFPLFDWKSQFHITLRSGSQFSYYRLVWWPIFVSPFGLGPVSCYRPRIFCVGWIQGHLRAPPDPLNSIYYSSEFTFLIILNLEHSTCSTL